MQANLQTTRLKAKERPSQEQPSNIHYNNYLFVLDAWGVGTIKITNFDYINPEFEKKCAVS